MSRAKSNKAPATAPVPEIDPAATYRVRLVNAIRVGRRIVAGRNIRLKGKVLSEALAASPAAIATYERD